MKTNFNPSSTCVSAYMSARNFARNSANNFRRITVLLVLLLSFAFGARAASYVFYYNGNYMYVNNGAIASTPTFSTACIWEGSNGGKFSNNGFYLVGNNNNNTLSLANNQNQGTSWTINGNNLYFQNRTQSVFIGSNYFYRGVRYNNGTWETVESDGVLWGYGNPSFEGNVAVLYQVNITPYSASTESVITPATSTITLTPSTAELNLGEQEIFTASASNITQVVYNTPEYTAYSFNNITHYYYGETMHTDKPARTEQPPRVLSPVFYWDLTGTGASYIESTPNGASNTLKVTSNPSADQTATLSVKAVYGDNVYTTPNASATITVKRKLDNPTGITAEDLTLAVDEQKSISYTLTPSNAYDNIAYSGYDNTIISIDANGIAKGLKAGITTVTLTAKNLNGTNSAHSATSSVTVTPKAPTIEFSIGANITATISTTETGATIYYTTDGTTPTTSSSVYTTPVSVTAGATVKAIVVVMANSTPLTSPVAEALANAESGIIGNTVFLYDLEDHNWTYYSGVNTSVDGGNYNDNYVGKLYSPNPRNVKITYNANGGAVSIDESETSFVYFKTLEQGATAGQYPYTVISNPFSKRPTGKGFGGWKIISGGEYINGYNNGSTLPLDQEITFVNLPYPSVNCISAEIVFEATWVNAKVTYLATVNNSNNNYTFNITNGSSTTTYENNFLVINRNYSGTLTLSQPVTIMMVEPNAIGTDPDYRDNYTFTGNITPNNAGVTKIEFAKWNSQNTLNCNNHSVTIGRGMITTSQCASYVTGVSSSTGNNNRPSYNVNLNYHLKLESGKFTDVSFIAGTEESGGYVSCNGTSNQVKGTLGNDYDRAKEDNTKLIVSDELFLGYRPTYGDGNQNNATFTCWVKSGNLCSETNVTNTTFNYQGSPNGGYYGDASQVFYVSSGGAQTNIGKRMLYVEGGILSGIAGGIDSNNPANNESFFVRMTGGQVRGVVYGSGAFAASSGIRRMIFTGGQINGWIAAGCNGTDPGQSGGTLPSDTYIYVGGNTHIGNATDLTLNTSLDGNVFGAGSGNSAQATTGQVNNSNVVIADDCYIKNNVYGGGNYGYSNAIASVYVTGGEVAGSVFGGSNQKQGVVVNVNMIGGQVDKGVYGGSNVTGTISGNVTMQINGGTVGTSSQPANIHGGGYGQATRVSGNVDITLGTVGQASDGVTVYGDVYGGSALGYVNGTTANDNYHTYVTLNKGTINGSLYGGGLGSNTVAANVYGPVKVEVHGGSVKTTDGTGENGSGGVYGANNINGAPQRSVTVDIYGTDPAPAEGQYALHAVYGGGNKAPYNGTPIVTVHNCDNSIEYVYGGGNAASVNSTNVTIWGGNKIGNVFGGGNGESGIAADVNGNAVTKIYGGTILNVYGGSNALGKITGEINVTVDSQGEGGNAPCLMNIGDVYGGGNRAASNVGNLNIVCTGTDGYINRVFGGANAAEITGDIELAINGGNIGSVFGGNNSEQSIEGNVIVNIGTAPNACGFFEIGNVHGGGYGKATGVTGNVEVNIAGGTINGDVYGGSALGKVNTNTSNTTAVNLTGGVIHGDAYGGGLGDSDTEADVNGNVTVTLNGTAFTLATTTDDKGNSIPTSGRIFGCNNINGSPKGTVLVKVLQTVAKNSDGTTKDKPTKGDGIYELQAVYGGGNLAAYNPTNPTANGQFTSYTWGVNAIPHDNLYKPVQVVIDGCDLSSIEYVYGGGNAAATPATDVTILGSYEIGSVFGGGNGKDRYTLDGGTTWNANKGADVGIIDAAAYATDKSQGKYGTGDAMTSVLGGTVHNIYGGSNTLGNIVGSATAYMDAASDCKLNAGDIYGGGNEAYMDGNSGIQLGCIEYLKEIYGGARNADVGGDINLTITSGHFDRVFGGNNLGGTIKGSITVNIEETGCNPITIGELYGCGNKAPYTTPGDKHPTINIRSFTSIGNVYGGGLGEEAVVTGNPTVNINVSEGAKSEVDWSYNGSTIDFGGGITVTLPVHEEGKIGAIGNVFGGGNAAAVIGNTQVNIGTEASKSADIRGNVYGGGNQADVTGQTNVVIGG